MTSTVAPTHATDPSASPDACGCEEGTRSGLSRRSMLGGLAALGLGATLAGLPGTQIAFAETGYTGDTLVAVSLRGGLDGLSLLAPIGDPDYAKARPTLAVPAGSAIKLSTMFGLHPAMRALEPFWTAKQLAFVHAVGQTSPTRSHFKAMEDMEHAAPGSTMRTGWLDRMLGLGSANAFAGVAMGGSVPPTSLMGPFNEMSLRDVEGFSLSGAGDAEALRRWRTALTALHHNAPAGLRTAARTTLASVGTAATLKARGYTPANGAAYPDTDLGRSLKEVARLIKAGVGMRAATVDVGGWDMHSGMGRVDNGWMFNKLSELGNALAAFWTDLGSKRADVTLVTLSEFGRRVAENGSGGTDHGHGNVSLVLGGGINGGKVYGRWPGLAAGKLVQGDLAGTTDYRTILAEIVERRQKLTASKVFPNVGSTRLGLARAK